jgi:hypothetical protein
MKLLIVQNYSVRVYEVIGYDNSDFFRVKFSLAQLLSNHTDTDTELLYTLQEDIDKIIDLKVNESLFINSVRDKDEAINNKAIISRIK